jgi:hypothetical protein
MREIVNAYKLLIMKSQEGIAGMIQKTLTISRDYVLAKTCKR